MTVQKTEETPILPTDALLPPLRCDLHTHTHYSRDSTTSLESIVKACSNRGINCLAVTDHNEIAGALALAETGALKVIIGEEITTTDGEIIGYFLTERIPPRLTPTETVRLIKEQGGLVCIPHPFDRLRRSRLARNALRAILEDVDIIEVCNSRVHFRADQSRALRFALENGLAPSAGSDAHTPGEFGGAYIEMADFNDPEEFLKSLRNGELHCRAVSPFIHFRTTFTRRWKKYFGR